MTDIYRVRSTTWLDGVDDVGRLTTARVYDELQRTRASTRRFPEDPLGELWHRLAYALTKVPTDRDLDRLLFQASRKCSPVRSAHDGLLLAVNLGREAAKQAGVHPRCYAALDALERLSERIDSALWRAKLAHIQQALGNVWIDVRVGEHEVQIWDKHGQNMLASVDRLYLVDDDDDRLLEPEYIRLDDVDAL